MGDDKPFPYPKEWEGFGGELTGTGMWMHYLLGSQVRKRYVE